MDIYYPKSHYNVNRMGLDFELSAAQRKAHRLLLDTLSKMDRQMVTHASQPAMTS